MKIKKSPLKNRLFVILVALAFWIWLAKDLVFGILHVQLLSGQLLTVLVTVLVLLFIAGNTKFVHNESILKHFKQKLLKAVLFFFCYCFFSGFISGDTAFTIFKLQSLLISIIAAYALADKTILAISMDKRLFFIVGLIIGVAGFYSVFSDINSYTGSIGLRAKSVAHLNIQDFYVVLFLYATTLFLGGDFHRSHLCLFLGAGSLCVPIVIALNSRMIPFTIGSTLVYLVVALRSIIFNHRKFMRYALLIVCIVLVGVMFSKTFISSESRMMRIYREGAIETVIYDSRFILFNEAFNDFLDSPLYGIGFGKFVSPGCHPDSMNRLSGTWPHNIFLELLSELGIIGFSLFVFPFGIVLKRVLFIRIKNNREFLTFPCLLFIYIFATMQLTQNIFYPFLWVGVFCCDAAFRYDKYFFPRPKKTLIVESS